MSRLLNLTLVIIGFILTSQAQGNNNYSQINPFNNTPTTYSRYSYPQSTNQSGVQNYWQKHGAIVPAQVKAGVSLNTANLSSSFNPQDYPIGRPTIACVANAAQAQNIPLDLMLGIQSVERGQTGQRVGNTNTTYDIGAFQINSINLHRVRSLGGSEYDLANRGCYNARIAVLIMSEALNHPKRQGYDFYTRAAGYHSWTGSHNAVYRKKLVNYTNQWQQWLKMNQLGHLVTAPVAY